MSFAGHLCWKPEAVGDVVVYDAVTPSDAVFLATHTSAPILRSQFQSTDVGSPCTEDELLRSFIETPADLILAPIIGQSGRGKSHLVRWLQINIPESPSRHVVYIPKYNTSLRGVIEEVLRNLSGPAAAKLRTDLATAAEDVDDSSAPEKLLYAIALRIQRQPTSAANFASGPNAAFGKEELQLRTYATKWLPELLRDHTFRSSLLAQETGVLTHFAREAIKGRSKADRDKPFAFEEGDLPCNVADVANAGVKVRDFYKSFVAHGALRKVCLDLLTEHLPIAVAEVIGLRSGDLYQVLLDLRRLLLEQGKELVLLIEDFTVLQGVEKELLDGLIEAPTRDGRKVMCGVRVAVAVTTGRFLRDFETVVTRAKFHGSQYHLDVPRVDDQARGTGIGRQEVIDFIGAYLNACRLGRSNVDAAYAAATKGQRVDGPWIDNACDDCDYEAKCRSGFGQTRRGHSLYPFNEAALERMIRARCGDSFDPREILGQILRYTLVDYGEEIRGGTFPSTGYVEQFKSDRVPPVEGILEAALRRDKDPRRLPLLTFWGANPKRPANLPAAVHEAFRLPALDDPEPPPPPPWDRQPLAPPPQPPLPPLPPPRPWVEAIDRWKDGTAQLDQTLARRLRNTIAEAVVQRVDWNEFCVPALAEQKFDSAGVRIEGAAGEGRVAPPTKLQLRRSSETARAFQALLWFEEHGTWKFEGGAAYLRDLSREIDRWAAEVRAQNRSPAADEATRALVEQMVEHALFGARVLGLKNSRSEKTVDLVNAVFEKAPDIAFKRTTPPSWEGLKAAVTLGPTQHEPTRKVLLDRLLFLVGRSQGLGKPAAIDATLLLDAIARIKRTWQLPEPGADAPQWLVSFYQRVAPHVEPAVAAEIERLRAWSDAKRVHFPDDKPLNEAVRLAASEVGEADEVAKANGVRKPGDVDKMEALATVVKEVQAHTSGFGQVIERWKFLEGVETASLGDKLAELATDRSKQMDQLERFVELANTFLGQTATRVETERANVFAAESQLGPTIDAIRAHLDEIVRALAPVGGGEP